MLPLFAATLSIISLFKKLVKHFLFFIFFNYFYVLSFFHVFFVFLLIFILPTKKGTRSLGFLLSYFLFHCTFKTAHKLFILKTSVHKRTFTKPHFVLSLLRNSVLFMIVRSLRFSELSNSHASMKFSNSGTTCELLYHFLP